MTIEPEALDSDMPSQIDRLVCGELNDPARRKLLAWLEANPVRWRLCGVAFLEAQAWSWAFDGWPRANNHAGAATRATQRLPSGRARVCLSPLFRRATVAAAVVVAFGLGLAFRSFVVPVPGLGETAVTKGAATSGSDANLLKGPSNGPSISNSVLAALNVDTGDGLGQSTAIQIPVIPAASDDSHAQDHAEIPDYVRQQWERRGYKVSLERRFMFAKLTDGRQVVVPVERLRINPLPIQIN